MSQQPVVFAAFCHFMRATFSAQNLFDFQEFKTDSSKFYYVRLGPSKTGGGLWVCGSHMKKMLALGERWQIKMSNDADELIISFWP